MTAGYILSRCGGCSATVKARTRFWLTVRKIVHDVFWHPREWRRWGRSAR